MAQTIDDTAKQPDKRSGTGFTNLQNMMDANQNNKLGSAVSSGVAGQFNQAKDSLGQAQGQFQQQLGNTKNQFQQDQT